MSILKQWLRRGLILLAATTFVISVPMTVVHAALVNHSFSFIGALDPDFGSIPITGSFQLTTVSGSSPGVYTGAVTDFSLNILNPGGTHGLWAFKPGTNAVTISKGIDLGSGNGDRWELVSAATGDQILNGTPPVVFTPVSFDLHLDRVGGGLFSDTSLQDPPSFSTLSNPQGVTGRWRLLFEGTNRTLGEYAGSIASLTAVPLPASVVLFGIGLISLVGLGAGRMRNLQGFRA